MATLHLLSQSPFAGDHLSNCLALAAKDDAVLLMGDAVYLLQAKSLVYLASFESKDITVFSLEEDLIARNITSSHGIAVINYDEFVALCVKYKKICSWF